MLAITSLVLRPRLAPSHCYEVLIPYTDPRESSTKGLPFDARLSMLVQVWAPNPTRASEYALERFKDHRRTFSRSAQIAAEGPIPLRVIRSE